VRALVIGGGSIGTRHLHNLKALGVTHLALFEPEAQRRNALCEEIGLAGFDGLDRALDWQPDCVMIASPTRHHVEQALEVAGRGYHLFIEKPLSHTEENLHELATQIEQKGLISLVGCNMRFHPGPARVRELLRRGVLGRLLFARLHTGSYLPGWRPGQDYRQSYSAHAAMGGGCLLDCIHEIDLAQWYCGSVEEVFCLAGHLSSLEVDVEDVAALICKHAGGVLSEVHLDYVQQTYERGCHIVGEQGSIFWDFNQGTVRWFEAVQGLWHTFAQPEAWQLNQMYVDELRHFLDCIHTGRQTTLPVSDAVEVMRVVFAAKASVDSGCMVRVA
jgi:predicted dehydrogenase